MHATLSELHNLGDSRPLVVTLVIFGGYLVHHDKLDEGEIYLQEGVDLARKVNFFVVQTLINLARLAYKRHDYAKAENFLQEADDLAKQPQDVYMKAIIQSISGRIKLRQGQLETAEQLLTKSLRFGWSTISHLPVLHTLVFVAELEMLKGHVKQGIMLLNVLCNYHGIEKQDRDEALKLLEKAKEQLSPQEFARAQGASKSLTLEGIVTGLLERAKPNATPETRLAARATRTVPSK
jgi:ATP/maltotriose-dependent transcriptional regulator MalT